MSKRTVLPGLLAMLLLAGVPAGGRFLDLSEPVPIERLVKNVGDYVERNPEDAAGHYTLGRIHSLAYAKLALANDASERKDDTILLTEAETLNERRPADDQVELPAFRPYDSVQVGPAARQGQTGRRPRTPKASPAAREHLAQSLMHYRRATELDPERALYALGHGWMLEQAALYPRDESPSPATQPATAAATPATRPAELPQVTDAYDEAARQYRRAFEAAYANEVDGYLAAGDMPISVEAGNNLARLLDRTGTDRAKADARDIRQRLLKVRAAPRAITPIVFSPNGVPVDQLIDPIARVHFDVAADGLSGRGWTWVRPQAALLVWDPQNAGRITSGTQLIGGRTWGMFWRDGYGALAALDNDRDGQLTAKELVGLSAWTDVNGNAVSDPGEVVPLLRIGVRSIAVAGESHAREDVAAWSPSGLTMTDGRVLPTWDWVAKRDEE